MAVRVMTTNFTDADLVAASSVSSEQTAFPVANLYNRQRRSRVWRSDGFWRVVESGDPLYIGDDLVYQVNNLFTIRETAGVNIGVTITPGTYDTPDFLQALEDALNAAGASTYTVTMTDDFKIKMASDGNGGGGIFEIRIVNPGPAKLLGGTVQDGITSTYNGALEYEMDDVRIHSEEWIGWDFGISSNPTAFIAIGLRNKALGLTPNATLRLIGSDTNNFVAAVAGQNFSQIIDFNEEAIAYFDNTGIGDQAYRYWWLHIDDRANPNGFVELGALHLGLAFQSERGQVQFPLRKTKIDRSVTSISEGGQTFSDIREKSERFQVDWQYLTIAEKESLDDFWDDVGTSLPFLIQLDPNLVFSSRMSKYIRYCKFESPPTDALDGPGRWSYSWNLREEL